MAKEKKIEPVEPKEEAIVEGVQRESFLDRKLKAINEMQKPAKAERLASRLFRKARNN